MTAPSPRTPDSREQFQQACLELRQKLLSGKRCRAEELISSYPGLSSNPDCAADLVLAEFQLRRQLGEAVTVQAFLQRFPHLSDRLEGPLRQLDTNASAQGPTLSAETAPFGETKTLPSATPGKLGHHEILEEIGKGGMGVVFKAHHTVLDRVFALKMIRGGILAGPDAVERFLAEARVVADLNHPNVVRIFEIGREGEQLYFTMAYEPGGSLDKQKQAYREARAAALLIEKVARAVHVAHQHGIIHRDLKPGNILIDKQGEPKVTDFGLAKAFGPDAPGSEAGPTPTPAQREESVETPLLTGRGGAVGTPAYMSPEQAQPGTEPVSTRCDTWALGVILYELLTGQVPFGGSSNVKIQENVVHATPTPPRLLRPDLDRRLEAIVLKCLEKEPARRYATAENLADDLAGWRRDAESAWPKRTWRRMRQHPVLAGVGVVLLLACVVGFWLVAGRDRVPKPDPSAEAEAGTAELKLLRQEVQEGKTVHLLRDTGWPRWSRPRCGGDKLLVGTRPGGRLTLEAFAPAVLELLSDPPESFTCSALVTSNGGKPSCEVGFCVALAECDGADGPAQFFCTLVLTTEPWNSPPVDKRNNPLNLASFRLKRYALADKAVGRDPFRKFNVDRTGVYLGEEQQLDLVVTPDRIEAAVAGKKLGSITWKDLTTRTRQRLPAGLIVKPPGVAIVADPGNEFGPLDFKRVFGLYVSDGSAEFRNVTITALPAQP